MNNNDQNFPELLKEYNSVSKRYYELSEIIDKAHKENLKLAKELLPRIKKAIIKEVFEKGNCFKGVWIYLEWASKEMGPHWQLNELGSLVSFKELIETNPFPGPIWKAEDLETRSIDDRILNRYFTRYEPKHDLLFNELKIKI